MKRLLNDGSLISVDRSFYDTRPFQDCVYCHFVFLNSRQRYWTQDPERSNSRTGKYTVDSPRFRHTALRPMVKRPEVIMVSPLPRFECIPQYFLSHASQYNDHGMSRGSSPIIIAASQHFCCPTNTTPAIDNKG